MKTAGSLVLALGLIAAAVLALYPRSVTVFGEEGTCNAPIVRVLSQQESDDPNAQALIDECEDRSMPWVLAALGVGLGAVVVGGGLLLVASRRPAPPGA